MSDNPFYHDYMGIGGGINTFPFFGENPSNYDQPIIPNIQNPNHEHQQFVPSSYMTLTECLHGSMDYNTLSSAFGMSCSSSSEVVCSHIDNQDSTRKNNIYPTAEPVLDSPLKDQMNIEIPRTPNSSISSTSNEAGGQEDSSKIKKKEGQEEGEDKSKKESKGKKKGEKKVKEARFAFMTKSEIDNLEDGYRWRKYGQKAVKNSPFPRNYYRCTTQKCSVKKRVERSYEDPSIVITTYEGQHNHHCPATLRGNAAAALLAPSFLSSSQQQLFHHNPNEQQLFNNPNLPINNSFYNNNYHQQQPQLGPDYQYGLFQDMVASLIHKREP